MSSFRVLLISGVAVGALAGGAIARFATGTGTNFSAGSSPAVALNKSGTKFLSEKKFGVAASLFRSAFGLVPESEYALNLATALSRQGDVVQALMALDAVRLSRPTAVELDAVRTLDRELRNDCVARRIECGESKPAEPSSLPPAKETEPLVETAAFAAAMCLKEFGKAELNANQVDSAIQMFALSLSVRSTSIVRFDLALSYFAADRFDETIAIAEALVTSEVSGSPLHIRALRLLGRARDACAKAKVECRK